jgi:hypothetical protein
VRAGGLKCALGRGIAGWASGELWATRRGVSSLFFFFSNSFSKEAFEKKTNKIKSETTAQKYYAQHECKNMFLPL